MRDDPQHGISPRERRRRDRKIWRTGLLLSLLVHLVVFFSWRGGLPIPSSPFAAAGPRAGDDRAAKGTMQAMNLSVAASRPIVRPPRPIEVAVEVEPVEFDDEAVVDPSDLLGERPGDAGDALGLPDGTGKGDGGNAAEGRYRLQPPSPRGMIIPPANDELRGTTVEVWVFVNAEGRVVPDSTRLNPPTKDNDFNKRLIREAAEWVFRPAMRAGEAVASWFPYEISM
jgi:hypothetical protein